MFIIFFAFISCCSGSVLALLAETKSATLSQKLSDYHMDHCVPCSAIINTIMESNEVDSDLKEQIKTLAPQLAQLTAKEMHQLLSAPPFKELFEKKYGSTNIVTYESLIILPNSKELEHYNQQDIPIISIEQTQLLVRDFQANKTANTYQTLTNRAVNSLRQEEQNAPQGNANPLTPPHTNTHPGFFANEEKSVPASKNNPPEYSKKNP